jgi:anti-anti-sigma factor
LQELLSTAISDRPRPILVDLSDVEFVECYSIGVIVVAWTTGKERGRSLAVDGVHGMPKVLFNVFGLGRLLATPAEDEIGGRDDWRTRATS